MLDIVLLVHNRPALTLQCLESLVRNTRSFFTLTIVDDCSDEQTQVLLEGWRWKYKHITTKLIRNEENMGTGASRNAGIIASAAKFGHGLLYLADNDCYFNDLWDLTLLKHFPLAYDLGFRVLGCYNHPYNGSNEVFRPMVGGYELHTKHAVGLISWAWKWADWEKYGPFDDSAKGVCQSEDYAVCQKIVKDGYKVGAIHPHLVLNCGKTNSFGQLSPGPECIESQHIPAGVLVE